MTPAERDAVIRAVAASERLAGFPGAPELVARLLGRLEQEEPEVTDRDAGTPPPDGPDIEATLRGMQALQAEWRWRRGRRVVALKCGRRQLEALRRALPPAESGSAPWVGASGATALTGLPVYRVDRPDFLEPVYADEHLPSRLHDEPPAE